MGTIVLATAAPPAGVADGESPAEAEPSHSRVLRLNLEHHFDSKQPELRLNLVAHTFFIYASLACYSSTLRQDVLKAKDSGHD